MYDENFALRIAIATGGMSPCAKSQRGVVVWDRNRGVMLSGYNGPPDPFRCSYDDACKAACSKIAVHAEELVIANAARAGVSLQGYEMLHVKVVNKKAVDSGGPSCWQCSRSILQSGLSAMWLLHEDGLRRYDPVEFHRLTLEANGLPIRELTP